MLAFKVFFSPRASGYCAHLSVVSISFVCVVCYVCSSVSFLSVCVPPSELEPGSPTQALADKALRSGIRHGPIERVPPGIGNVGDINRNIRVSSMIHYTYFTKEENGIRVASPSGYRIRVGISLAKGLISCICQISENH